jgi:hypothetical protein
MMQGGEHMNEQAWLVLIGALIVGAVAQGIAKQEAAILGLSVLEVALLGTAAGAIAIRKAR